jgi:hypothetical protein
VRHHLMPFRSDLLPTGTCGTVADPDSRAFIARDGGKAVADAAALSVTNTLKIS